MVTKSLTACNMYRSPSSSRTDDEILCNVIKKAVQQIKRDIIIVGDFNFPEINWDSKQSNNNSYSSTLFLDTIQNLLLTQHVDFPTRARGEDTPHIS